MTASIQTIFEHSSRLLGAIFSRRATAMPAVPHLRLVCAGDEDHTKDIDFTPTGIRARWEAGYELAQKKIHAAPWNAKLDPAIGVVLHE